MAGTVLALSVQSIATRVAGAQNLQIVYAYQVTGQHELFLLARTEMKKSKKLKMRAAGVRVFLILYFGFM